MVSFLFVQRERVATSNQPNKGKEKGKKFLLLFLFSSFLFKKILVFRFGCTS